MGATMPRGEMKFLNLNLDLKGLSEEGVFAGYASVFGEVDLGKDMIEPGAFSRSLRSRGPAGVRMLFQHDPAAPLGRWMNMAPEQFLRGLQRWAR